ncbi:HPr family phosphocarrier protein [Erythrobacteraceae bacterium CFH 75059]|uniref:HPr family phosphocarrier protein n=1 Tax=Qipengyuania thermophila TaxID=2509361 RepID=UPI00102215B0|nr:HPr family phosphocarrier protein [Qipengyuania thermophila]TCD02277.1 HPr family phosphocarrier protein [Erythrobacteraceae bacterium CFH 75059]
MTVSRTLVIVNQRGLHARASARFVTAVANLSPDTRVEVAKGPHCAAGGSILGLMMLGAARGDTIELRVSGADADAVADQLAQLVSSGFGEE